MRAQWVNIALHLGVEGKERQLCVHSKGVDFLKGDWGQRNRLEASDGKC